MSGLLEKIEVDAARIEGWDGFHDVFAKALGIVDFYGRNKDAWYEVMEDRDGLVMLTIRNASRLKSKWPDIYTFILEGCAQVNFSNVREGSGNQVIVAIDN